MKSTYKAVVFDLDGTLLDTSEGVFTSVKYAVKMLGLPEPDDSMVSLFIGPPIKHSLRDVYGLDEEKSTLGTEYFRNRYKDHDLFLAKPYEGILDLLKALKDAGCKLGVATLKRQDYAYDLLKHFGITDYCETVCGCDADSRLLKPDILSNCLSILGVDPSEAVLIGDTSSDAKGAKAVGTALIGVTFGFGPHDKEGWAEFAPVLVADSTKDIAEFLEVTI